MYTGNPGFFRFNTGVSGPQAVYMGKDFANSYNNLTLLAINYFHGSRAFYGKHSGYFPHEKEECQSSKTWNYSAEIDCIQLDTVLDSPHTHSKLCFLYHESIRLDTIHKHNPKKR